MAIRERNQRTTTTGKGVLKVAKGFIITENTFDDDRIKLIEALPSGDETLVIYFRLLALACKSNAGGFILLNRSIPFSEEMLATLMNRSIPKVRFALQTLTNYGMIEETNEGFKIDDFEKWLCDKDLEQEKARQAVQDHREKQAALAEPKKKKVYEEDSIEMQLSKYLFQLMRKNNPEAKEPNFQSWCNDMRKLINLDKRKPEQIKNMIDWCQKDSFWKGNILSVKKLREKYDQLKVRALEEWERQQGRPTNSRQAEIDDIFNRLEGGNSNDLPRSIEGN